MKFKYQIILSLIFLFTMVLVSSQPPFATQTTGTPGLILISTEPPVALANNSNYEIHVHILNNTNGKLVNSSITCFYHLTGLNGSELFQGALTQDVLSDLNSSYEGIILGGNFSHIGTHNLLVQCLSADGTSGITRLFIDVTYGGRASTTPITLGYGFALTLLVLMFYGCVVALVRLPQGNPKDEYGEILSINHLKYLKLPLIGLAYWLVVAISFMISTMARYYLSDALITNFFFAIFTWMMRLGIVLIFVLAGLILLEIFRDKEIKNLMDRGLPTR